VIGLAAAVLGFTGIAIFSPGIAKFIALIVISLLVNPGDRLPDSDDRVAPNPLRAKHRVR